MLILVTATRLSRSDFNNTPLGRSVQRLAFDPSLRLSVIADNAQGLPSVFNPYISETFLNDEIVFLHDDLWLDDIFFAHRIHEALNTYDVAGLAGNRRLLPEAPAWCLKNDRMEWDSEHLTGLVCHGPHPCGAPSVYGPTPATAQLLDGLLIAVRVSALLKKSIRFDERFDFHFYDLDFSRQANTAGLKVGTWPIAVTHASGGAFRSPSWQSRRDLYRAKWSLAR